MSDEHAQHDGDTKALIRRNIEQHDCFLAMLEADEDTPGFVYSIGLFEKFRHPELICFGLDLDLMGELVNQVRDFVREGNVIETGKDYEGFLENFPIRFIEVDKTFYPPYLGYAIWNYQGLEFPALQLVWTDMQGGYPWEEGVSPNLKFQQPLLDRNTDFWFYEERDRDVFTTQSVLDGAPVLYVYHQSNGDWQFHASDDIGDDVAKVLSLEQIVQLDPSLNKIYHLQRGWCATREEVDMPWNWEPFDEPDEE